MLIWAGMLLVLAIIFGFLAFNKKRASASQAAKILFFISLVLLAVAVFGLLLMYFHPEMRVRVEPPLIP